LFPTTTTKMNKNEISDLAFELINSIPKDIQTEIGFLAACDKVLAASFPSVKGMDVAKLFDHLYLAGCFESYIKINGLRNN
jgi:hypothetical protein